MADIPDMPADWWPDKTLVTGETEHEGRRLTCCFVVSAQSAKTYLHPAQAWGVQLDALRQAMWNALHDEKSREMIERA